MLQPLLLLLNRNFSWNLCLCNLCKLLDQLIFFSLRAQWVRTFPFLLLIGYPRNRTFSHLIVWIYFSLKWWRILPSLILMLLSRTDQTLSKLWSVYWLFQLFVAWYRDVLWWGLHATRLFLKERSWLLVLMHTMWGGMSQLWNFAISNLLFLQAFWSHLCAHLVTSMQALLGSRWCNQFFSSLIVTDPLRCHFGVW